jgi:hypothetical protein
VSEPTPRVNARDAVRQRLADARDRYLDAMRDQDELQRERAAFEEMAAEVAAGGRDDHAHNARRKQLEARRASLAKRTQDADREVDLAETEAQSTLSQEELAGEWERYLGRLRKLLDALAGAPRA